MSPWSPLDQSRHMPRFAPARLRTSEPPFSPAIDPALRYCPSRSAPGRHSRPIFSAIARACISISRTLMAAAGRAVTGGPSFH